MVDLTNQDFKLKVYHNMKTFGGNFIKSLAECIILADGSNLRKLQDAIEEYIIKYADSKWNG